MQYLVTGAAGFLGRHLVARLLHDGHRVVGHDRAPVPLPESDWMPGFWRAVHGDLCDRASLVGAMQGVDGVFHLAGKADVQHSLTEASAHIEANVVGTLAVLLAMQECRVSRIALASTAAVYGEPTVVPTPEDAPFPIQTSVYGASKLAAEGLIQAYCAAHGWQAYIYRFAPMLGEYYHHGHVIDFVRQLRAHPDFLDVRGNGLQRKSYLYAGDAVDGMLTAWDLETHGVGIFNVGRRDACTVRQSVHWICEALGLLPTIRYGTEAQGWVGDNPNLGLDCTRLEALGWQPRTGLRESVQRTVRWLEASPWTLPSSA